MKTLESFTEFVLEQPFTKYRTPGRRYHFKNPAYSFGDGLMLYSMMRSFRPERIIEVGCGYSSALILDTNELFFDWKIECTFIDPYPKNLVRLLRFGDLDRVRLVSKPVQDVELNLFKELEDGDILFIDSSHVSKVGSDVNFLFAEVLPVLRSGVLVHIHDIFYPFEYPMDWTYEGRYWNEAYLLRAFLQYNEAFEILLFSSYLRQFHPDVLADVMPAYQEDPGGCLWLRRR